MADTFLVSLVSGVDSHAVAVLWACIIFLVGFAWVVVPDAMVRQYVVERKGNVKVQDTILQSMGGDVLATSVASLCMLLFEDMNAVKAIGYLGVAWCLLGYKSYLEGVFLKVKKDALAVLVLSLIVTTYAGLNQVEWAESAFNVMILVFSLSAIAGIISPSLGLQMWCGEIVGEDKAGKKSTEFCMKGMSFFLLGQELHNYLLLQGIKPEKALAYATIPGLCHFVSALFITKEAQRDHVKATGYYVWMAVDLTMIALILFLQ